MSLNFNFSKNNNSVKVITVEPNSLDDYSEYRKALKNLQGKVNEYLTDLVNTEAATTESLNNEDDGYLSSDSEGKQSPKRNLSNDRGSHKNKIKKH